MKYAWSVVYHHSPALGLQPISLLLTLYLGSIFAGALSVHFNYGRIMDHERPMVLLNSFISGLVSGTIMVLTFIGYSESILFLESGEFGLPGTGVMPLSHPIFLLPALIATAFSMLFSYAIKSSEVKHARIVVHRLCLYGIITIGALLFLSAVIPPLAMVASGYAETEHDCCFTVAVTANRLDNDTIMLINCGGNDVDMLDDNTPFTIFVDGLDISDIDALKKGGRDYSLSPDNGLGKAVGSSLNITGIRKNDNEPVQILVRANQKNGENAIMLNCFPDVINITPSDAPA